MACAKKLTNFGLCVLLCARYQDFNKFSVISMIFVVFCMGFNL